MSGRYLVLLIIILSARPAFASVSINEVAWMGDTESANHEWIELYNEGSEAVAVDGWTLDDGMNLNIELVGTISAGSYAVLERTSEDSAPGAAFVIYTGALVNTGAVLVLRDGEGTIKDQITGGENWVNIGGDNTTKETAQYTSGGWVTDMPTPGDKNGAGRVEEVVTESTPKETTTTSSKSSSGGSKSTSSSVNLKNVETKFTLKPNVQTVAYVNQNIPLSVVASGIEEASQGLVDFEWNFGDGYVASTRKVNHSYLYPGSYVITIYAKKDKYEQVVRQEITVLPVNFSITHNDNGDVQIHNDAPYDVDLSGYVLQGVNAFVLPPRTIILPKATITIPASMLGGRSENSLVALYDGARTLVTSNYENNSFLNSLAYSHVPAEEFENTPLTYTTKPSPLAVASSKEVVTSNNSDDFNFGFPLAMASQMSDTDTNVSVDASGEETAQTPAEGIVANSPSENARWPYLALITLLLVALVGVFMSKGRAE